MIDLPDQCAACETDAVGGLQYLYRSSLVSIAPPVPAPMTSCRDSRPLVLHVRTMTGRGGGPEKTILNSPRFLRRLGYTSICAYTHPPADPGFDHFSARAVTAEAPLVSIPDRGPFDVDVLRRLVQFCRQENVAIWHAHDYKTNVLGLLARRFWPMKLATTVHGWGHRFKRTPFYYRIDKLTLRYYDEVICVSLDLRDECLRYGVPRDRCHLIFNAIDTEEFCRANLGWPNLETPTSPLRTFVVGALGRLEDEKCFDLLIAATDRLISAGRDVSLVIGGEGAARPKLEQQIAATARPQRIRLLGHVETKDFFRELDAFVLCSCREGLPNVVLEAMALEVPLVCTPVGGIPDVVSDGVNGRIVPVGNVDALAAGIACILDNPAQTHSMAAAARRTIEDRFSFQRRMEKMVAIYDRMLKRPRNDAPLLTGAMLP